MADLCNGDAATKGYWDDEAHRIVIRKDLDLDQQWWTLWHEMGHMWLDLWYMDEESYMEEG